MYHFHTSEELLKLCRRYKAPISEIAIRYEIAVSKLSRKEVWEKMEKVYSVMYDAIQKSIKTPQISAFKMSEGDAPKIISSLKDGHTMFLNPLAVKAMAYAIGTGELNSAMGRIVACPTAGASGVIPGCIQSIAEEWDLSEEKIIRGLFNASAIGIIIANNATLAGAVGGCQAENGSACAMAASAITEMRGGSQTQCLNAAALALKSKLGLACDPLGGLVAVPCIKRNALGAVEAIGASDLTMAGVKSFIPFDEVVLAMKNIGDVMSEKIKETALGGLATTKTGERIKKKLNSMA